MVLCSRVLVRDSARKTSAKRSLPLRWRRLDVLLSPDDYLRGRIHRLAARSQPVMRRSYRLPEGCDGSFPSLKADVPGRDRKLLRQYRRPSQFFALLQGLLRLGMELARIG